MAIRTVDELTANLNTIIGERDDDEALEFIQDFSDTVGDLSSHRGDYTKQQYDDLDAKWRKRYKERFFRGSSNDDDLHLNDNNDEGETDTSTSISIKDLFTKK